MVAYRQIHDNAGSCIHHTLLRMDSGPWQTWQVSCSSRAATVWGLTPAIGWHLVRKCSEDIRHYRSILTMSVPSSVQTTWATVFRTNWKIYIFVSIKVSSRSVPPNFSGLGRANGCVCTLTVAFVLHASHVSSMAMSGHVPVISSKFIEIL